jgi:hypothetical protein
MIVDGDANLITTIDSTSLSVAQVDHQATQYRHKEPSKRRYQREKQHQESGPFYRLPIDPETSLSHQHTSPNSSTPYFFSFPCSFPHQSHTHPLIPIPPTPSTTPNTTMADPDPNKWRIKRDPNLPPPPNPNARTSTPKPNLLGNNPGFQNFDLSDDQFTSDGEDQYWPTRKTRIADKDFLEMLTEAYNKRPELVAKWSTYLPSLIHTQHDSNDTNAQWKTGGQPINFEGEPPKGYALFKQSDYAIHGHPSGLTFRSLSSFVDHVHAIMIGRVGPCCCVVCIKEGTL